MRKVQFPPKIRNFRGSARIRWKGKDYYLGRFGSPESQQAYEKLIAELSKEQPVYRPITLADPTVTDVCERYLSEVLSLKDRRENENCKQAIKPLLRVYGDLPAKRFRAAALEEMQKILASGSWMTAEEKAHRKKYKQPIGWCRPRVNRMVIRIRTIFRFAERKELVPDGTWNHLRTVEQLNESCPFARDGRPYVASSIEDVRKVASFCPKPVAAMLELQWWTGMRSGEVRIIRTMDIDRSGDVWLYKPGSELPYGRHKNAHRKQSRVVPLGPECQRILADWLRPDRPGIYLFRPKGGRSKNPYYDRHSYSHAVNRACVKAKVKLHAYGGRHAAKNRITREAGIEAAAAVLGQKRLATTESYGTLDLEHAKETARKLG